jgi:hypothetical protein
MTGREIVSVLWHQRGNSIRVVYLHSDAEDLVGSEAMAAELAEEAGLERVPTSSGTSRWIRPLVQGDSS